MARSRVRPDRKKQSEKIKDPSWSVPKRIFMTIVIILSSIVAVVAIIGAVLHYIRHVSN